MKNNDLVVLDKITGEIVEDAEFYRKDEFEEAVEKEVKKTLENAQKQREGLEKMAQKQKALANGKPLDFIQCIQEPIIEVLPKLNITECGSFMLLLSYMQQRKGGLLTHKTSPLNQKHIQKIFGKEERRTRAILTNLEALKLIRSEWANGSKIYYINEKYHTMGKRKRGRGNKIAPFIKLMKTKLGEIVKHLSPEALGILYKIIPYFHYTTFAISSTPNEPDDEKIKNLSCAGLARLLDLDRATVAKYIDELSANGIILSTKSKKSIIYYVHPDVLWSCANPNTDSADALRRMFTAHTYKSLPKN